MLGYSYSLKDKKFLPKHRGTLPPCNYSCHWDSKHTVFSWLGNPIETSCKLLHLRGMQASWVPLQEPSPHHTTPAHSSGKDTGSHSSKNSSTIPPHTKFPLVAESASSHWAQLTLWPGARMNQPETDQKHCSWAQWRQAGWVFSNTSCSTAHWKRLFSFVQALHCHCLASSQNHHATSGHLQSTYPPKGGDHKLGQGTCSVEGCSYLLACETKVRATCS